MDQTEWDRHSDLLAQRLAETGVPADMADVDLLLGTVRDVLVAEETP